MMRLESTIIEQVETFVHHPVFSGSDRTMNLVLDELEALERKGQIATRAELLEEVWGYSGEVYSRTVDTHVAELRRKLEDNAAEPRHILTVRKTGYRIATERVSDGATER